MDFTFGVVDGDGTHRKKTLFTSNSGPFILLKLVLGLKPTKTDRLEAWRKVQGDLQRAATDEDQLERPSVTLSPDAVSKHKAVLDPCRAGTHTFNAKQTCWRVHRTGGQDRLVHSCCSFESVNLPPKGDLDTDAPLEF